MPRPRACATLASVLLASYRFRESAGELLGAAVLPHGDFAFDPGLLRSRSAGAAEAKARALALGATEAGRFVAGLGAEVLILTTPHGAATSREVAAYGNSHLAGPALVGRDVNASFGPGTAGPGYWADFEAAGNPELAKRVALEFNRAVAGTATVLEGWGDDLPLPLRWGEVLPLRFVAPEGRLREASLLVLSLPTSRRGESGRLADAMRRLGRTLGGLLKNASLRAGLVVSTDLSHRHWSNTTFGWSERAAPFDEGCGHWAATLDWEVLRSQQAFVDEIFSCGWLGLALLHGALEATGEKWLGHVHASPAAPTYYGMMAASFRRVDSPTRPGELVLT